MAVFVFLCWQVTPWTRLFFFVFYCILCSDSFAVPGLGEGHGSSGMPCFQRQQCCYHAPPPVRAAHHQAAVHPYPGRDPIFLGNDRGTYHIISYYIISYHIIAYHVVSYNVVTYHILIKLTNNSCEIEDLFETCSSLQAVRDGCSSIARTTGFVWPHASCRAYRSVYEEDQISEAAEYQGVGVVYLYLRKSSKKKTIRRLHI